MSDKASSEQRILSGQSWDDFCDALKKAGRDVVMADTAPDDLLARAEGWRYMARLTRAGLASFLEATGPTTPEFRQPVGHTIKMGMDNPDNVYLSTSISGEYSYKITGKRGTVHFCGFGSQAGGYGKTGTLETTGSLDISNIELDEDGGFEVIASATPHKGNWLPMTADTNMIQLRQSHADRTTEIPATVTIERIDGPAEPRPFDPLRVDNALQSAAFFAHGTSALFASWSEKFKSHTNELPRFDPAVALAAGGDPKIAYYHSYFDIADDEALVITLTPPECDYWNIQLANYWLESLDYRFYPVHFNHHTASYNDDGTVTVVISPTDPGCKNWLNTCGHNQGTMCVRWVGAEQHPTPKAQLVKLAELT
ncbi:hypothetical protein SIN8267_02822 [Sinobacterium norvegicum]|uniref:DUF1214 domain-containing protein n=1 Tax=Sinobacterium norvegicum TaxID=1641715 RepID=A0ABN8EKS4_9GAMM|nr:DUF1214 domain-containing protein [Sinobacterium norvegicum]CAH0992689.1 hypothetical protein SIN8267_02822 [Sinobacterium norvegicum]